MGKHLTNIAVLLASLAVAGCASTPWAASKAAGPAADPVANFPRDNAVDAARPNPQKMQEVMADLRQLGALDPAAQDKLMEDLRQSDPSLWPLIVEQARATAAYRRRAMERAAVAMPGAPPTPEDRIAATPPDAPPTYPSTGATPVELQPVPNQPPVSQPTATSEPAGSAAPPNQVTQVSYNAPVEASGSQRLAAAIATLEAEVPANPTTPSQIAQHARLRMLYAVAGRRDDALRPIPAASPAAQQFLTKELAGLSAWLDAEQMPDAARRSAEAKAVLVEALSKLSESAPLVVRNLAFCTEVLSYGCAKRFEKYEFQPNQEALLYAEVENFASEPTAKGYHTALRSSYRINDSAGRTVAEHTFPVTEEYCQNLRRDYFIGYRVRLPKRIAPGKYTLRLSIEDIKCQKIGQMSIDFEVRAAKGEAEKTAGAPQGGPA